MGSVCPMTDGNASNWKGTISQLFSPTAPGLWFVLHTKSRQEKALAEALTLKGIANFLPLIKQKRTWAGRKAIVEVPLFSSYLFLRGTLDDCYDADRSSRVAQIIQVHDQLKLTQDLKNLAQAIDLNVALDPYPYLIKGIRAAVRSGPLQGIEGVIESRTKRDRLILQVDMLGRGASLEIDAALLEPTE